MRRFYWVLILVALAGGAIITLQARRPDAGGATVRNPLPDTPTATVPEVGTGIVRGADAAPLTIHEFADYQCPACAQFAREAEPELIRDYVEPGRVRLIFHDFPLVSMHPVAYAAALAARCAGEHDRYWETHALLFARQQEWSRAEEPIGALADVVSEAGPDSAEIESCIRAERYREEVVSDLEQAERLRLRGTPTLFVGRHQIVGSLPYDSLRTIIEKELAATR